VSPAAFALSLALVARGAPAGEPPTATAVGAAQPVLSLDDYAGELDEIRGALAAGRTSEARRAARALEGRAVAWRDETLAPDDTLLEAVAKVTTVRDAQVLAGRVGRLALALRAADAGVASAPEPRPALLDRLALPADAPPGGSIPQLALRPLAFPERLAAALLAVWDRLVARAKAVGDWLRRLLLPRGAERKGDAAGVGRAAVAFVVLAVVALLMLALRALRRRRTPPVSVASAPASFSADDDPLSRESAEWEARARALAAAQRFREAVRAWYHAVLTALFRLGELQYRKGRTNWEYVAAVGPERRWRPGFIELTGSFDREWYGRRSSDREALAAVARLAANVLAELHDRGSAR
jgi:hypothetical protein